MKQTTVILILFANILFCQQFDETCTKHGMINHNISSETCNQAKLCSEKKALETCRAEGFLDCKVICSKYLGTKQTDKIEYKWQKIIFFSLKKGFCNFQSFASGIEYNELALKNFADLSFVGDLIDHKFSNIIEKTYTDDSGKCKVKISNSTISITLSTKENIHPIWSIGLGKFKTKIKKDKIIYHYKETSTSGTWYESSKIIIDKNNEQFEMIELNMKHNLPDYGLIKASFQCINLQLQ